MARLSAEETKMLCRQARHGRQARVSLPFPEKLGRWRARLAAAVRRYEDPRLLVLLHHPPRWATKASASKSHRPRNTCISTSSLARHYAKQTPREECWTAGRCLAKCISRLPSLREARWWFACARLAAFRADDTMQADRERGREMASRAGGQNTSDVYYEWCIPLLHPAVCPGLLFLFSGFIAAASLRSLSSLLFILIPRPRQKLHHPSTTDRPALH